jgi:transcription initiation factor TFIIE subunit alpha
MFSNSRRLRMLNNPLVQDLLYGIINENNEEDDGSMQVIEYLDKGFVTDEDIAEATDLRLNIVRRVLYKLYDSGLASYKRSKDPDTQWFTYEWTFEKENVKEMCIKKRDEEIQRLREALEFEENNMFFLCKSQDCRLTFEDASDLGFICPECGNMLEFADNSEIIDELKSTLEMIDSELEGEI